MKRITVVINHTVFTSKISIKTHIVAFLLTFQLMWSKYVLSNGSKIRIFCNYKCSHNFNIFNKLSRDQSNRFNNVVSQSTRRLFYSPFQQSKERGAGKGRGPGGVKRHGEIGSMAFWQDFFFLSLPSWCWYSRHFPQWEIKLTFSFKKVYCRGIFFYVFWTIFKFFRPFGLLLDKQPCSIVFFLSLSRQFPCRRNINVEIDGLSIVLQPSLRLLSG